MEVCTAKGKELDEKFILILQKSMGLNHHIYQDFFYNSVKLCENSLKKQGFLAP
jgi:hypothetical protein